MEEASKSKTIHLPRKVLEKVVIPPVSEKSRGTAMGSAFAALYGKQEATTAKGDSDVHTQ